MIKAAIFDMDGVIVDSEHLNIKAGKQTMLKYGIRVSSEELQRFTRTTAQAMFRELIKRYKLDTTFEKMSNEREEKLLTLLKEGTRPTRGVMELLKKLKQENIKLAIASSSHRRLIEYVLERLNITHIFDLIVSSEDIKHSKPNPEIFLKSAKELDVNPIECLVFEDSKLGVEAAKNAGMRCVGYRNPNSGNQDLSKADIVVDDFSKLDIQELLK